MRSLILFAAGASLAAAASAAEPVTADKLADDYVDLRLARDPLSGLASGLIDAATVRLPDRSPAALAAADRSLDAIAASLDRLDGQGRQAALLKSLIDTDRGLRVCQSHYWNVSHLTGWQIGLSTFAARQPVSTPETRAAALAFWRGVPAFIDTEIANLKAGLDHGYSVPKPVAERVIQQFDGALAAPDDKAPLLSPAGRAGDAAFAATFGALYAGEIKPALTRYRDFLRDFYLPRARDTLGLSALPDGKACYEAQLRAYTTLDRNAGAVFALGEETVAANRDAVARIGKEKLGAADFADTVRKAGAAPDNRFASEEEMLAFLRAAVARGMDKSAPLFAAKVEQPITVEPLPDYQRGSGIPSHYQPSPDPAKPAIYRTTSYQWADVLRGDAEVTAMHEAAPGHHLQTVLSRSTGAPSRLDRIAFNPAFFEGWGRYAEGLAEEAGAYSTPYAAIARRVWPGRGLIADPGIHLFGWTREQAVALIVESGRFGEAEAQAMVDRIAAMPAQLTAYDSGAIEIASLRAEAERRLGAKFDLPSFHAQILGAGALPLTLLRADVRRWIAERERQP